MARQAIAVTSGAGEVSIKAGVLRSFNNDDCSDSETTTQATAQGRCHRANALATDRKVGFEP